MKSRMTGSILLIVAMSIGGGLLSLPVVTASGGFYNASLLLFVVWSLTAIGSLFLLEICLRLPKDSNLISMARDILGTPGEIIIWFSYLLMLYCIMCVYISGGTDLVHSIWNSFHLNIYTWVSSLIFVGFLGAVVWHGIKLVDHVNRALMTSKLVAYFLLIIFLIPTVSAKNLPSGSLVLLTKAIMPAIFAFAYSIIIPSLCSYLDRDVKKLRLVILIGSFIPLVCFILWNYAVQGTIPQSQLISISHSGEVISALNNGLSAAGNPWIITITHIFTTICLLTAFLAVSLSLSDVLSDGIKKPKKGKHKILIYGLTFLPPLVIIIFYPYIFITAIHYAGILVLFTLLLMPTIMVWRSRNKANFKNTSSYQVFGGNFTVLLMMLSSLALLVYTFTQL